MKHFRAFLPLALILLVAACAPGLDSPEQITDAFTLTVDGQTYPAENGRILYSTDEYALSFQLSEESVSYVLRNETEDSIRIDYNESAIVLPSGSSSRLIPDDASFVTRNDIQPPIIVPTNAQSDENVLPVDNVNFGDYGLRITPYLDFPNDTAVTFRVALALTINGVAETEEFIFSAPPYQQ